MGTIVGNINNVANLLGTPGCITDDYDNRPLITSVLIGTLFFAIDTGAIYQSDGTNWVQLGGTGTSQNWNQVLAQGGTFSSDRNADFDFNNLNFVNVNEFTINTENVYIAKFDTSGFKYNATNGIQHAISVNTETADVALGDFSGLLENGTHLFVNSSSNRVYIAPQGVNVANFASRLITLGDPNSDNTNTNLIINTSASEMYFSPNGINVADFTETLIQLGYINDNGIKFSIDQTQGNIYTKFGGVTNGFKVDFFSNLYFLGDVEGLNNETYIYINDSNAQVIINATGLLNLQYTNNLNLSGLSITQVGSGSTSNQHLKVNVNGTNYVIELKNP